MPLGGQSPSLSCHIPEGGSYRKWLPHLARAPRLPLPLGMRFTGQAEHWRTSVAMPPLEVTLPCTEGQAILPQRMRSVLRS